MEPLLHFPYQSLLNHVNIYLQPEIYIYNPLNVISTGYHVQIYKK